MNLYTRKQQFKILLLFLAVLIVGVSLWYSNLIVNKIRQEERLKVQLWSEAVKKRLILINYTEKLFEEMRREERIKVKIWAQAVNRFLAANESQEILFLQEVMLNNNTIPVLIVDDEGNLLTYRNINEADIQDYDQIDSLVQQMGRLYPPIRIDLEGIRQKVYYQDSRLITDLEHTLDDLINSFISETVMNSGSVPVLFTDSTSTKVLLSANVDTTLFADSLSLANEIKRLTAANPPIKVQFGEQSVNYIYYDDSVILTQLKYYPIAQMVIVGLFLFISYLIFSTFRNAEQNQVWVGMAKETAHQLGTPLSSLMAWVQLLEARGTDAETIAELNKDVARLETITDRFSKIGSAPELKPTDVSATLQDAVDYLKPRLSSKLQFDVHCPGEGKIKAMINKPLFGWVIENLVKNAVDAMEGQGKISIDVSCEGSQVFIDVSDTGKGISANKQKAVFQPGYTTKKRGWGLGLSLARRIIENYHRGKIFVKRSEPDKGTTFRIVLKTES
jgi:nitrogen-specific signal transduction histidine kinase